MSIRYVTNLDYARDRERWPRDHTVVPQIGATVVSERGLELKVVGVTHLYGGDVEVELHARCGMNIAEWEAWYLRHKNEELFRSSRRQK
jgi:hypothetical protein